MSNFVVRFFAEFRRKRLLSGWKSLALSYRGMGETDHWIRARITEYVYHKDADESIVLKPNQTKDDYIEDILSVLNESKTMSG